MSENVLEKLLEAIDTETGRALLADLRDDERRSPQLYNAIGKYLERHKFTIAKLKPDESLLGDLAAALDGFQELEDGELYGEGVRH
ncbi:terminase small subunit [Pseudomonas phage ALEA]|uniref:Terminase small subunit n=1 Tax=Pseudomonas phage AH05 TaxID=2869574 RepID=A0AAE8BVN8_9CAUD|nr:terminase small subunit [Pseudomonas phage AH05]UAV89351.1 terminase small subunit [Pseudomonas phage ALEA]UAV89450.1 terminase small subunit [Pseudomonas phage JOR]UAV89500.1 terminase small subunit [Pseudomonas phage M1.1]UAV89549.1 terminase small subunit [Pseudomonas phage M1.2]UAV89598.1 terminase small subunit [Pseudomonas phage M3.1]UAV89821.1 terminase small subunit [Pseudomonas phage NOI]UAV90093.1 terminase small subunit [Pseudomonas phage SNK]WVH05479.1 terminase small subunit